MGEGEGEGRSLEEYGEHPFFCASNKKVANNSSLSLVSEMQNDIQNRSATYRFLLVPIVSMGTCSVEVSKSPLTRINLTPSSPTAPHSKHK
jgi:hypothetical protein